MSGSVDYGLLLGSSGSSYSGIDPGLLLQAVGGGGGTGQPLVALRNAERDQVRDVGRTAKQPDIARAIARFTTAVTHATSVAKLLQNPDVLSVLLTANGLGDQADYPALARKALLSDTTNPKSLANTLADTRWKAVAKTYDFARAGLSVLQNPKVLGTLANGYAEVAWRQSLDASTPGLSTALDFRARASTATSVDQILGDATFRSVVTKALGIPAQIAFQTLGAQETAIGTHLNLKKLKDPKYVEGLAQQYLLAMRDAATATGSSSLESLATQSAGVFA